MLTLSATDTNMKSLASELKSEREKQNTPLEQIAQETCISLRHLQSLEEGRYSDMPGGIYNRAFLKAYCEFLNLDQKEILQRYEAELLPHSEKPVKSPPRIPQTKAHFWSNPVFAWSLMLAISATGLFFSRKWISSVFSPYFTHTSPGIVKTETIAEPKALPVPSEQQFETTSNPNMPQPDVALPSAPAPFAAEARLETIPSSETASTLRVEFEVTEKCWISVDSDKGRVISKILEPGEAQVFDAAEHFFIVIGNAGGVHLRINGRPAKPLGKPGEVVKMLIDSKSLPALINQTTG